MPTLRMGETLVPFAGGFALGKMQGRGGLALGECPCPLVLFLEKAFPIRLYPRKKRLLAQGRRRAILQKMLVERETIQ